MNIIVFTSAVSGHNIEYLHHLYEMALSKPSNNYVFLVPDDFKNKKNFLRWKEGHNVKFSYYTTLRKKYFIPFLSSSLHYSKLLKQNIKTFDCSLVFAVNLMVLLPSILLLPLKNVRIMGIDYKIYLYDKSRFSSLIKILLYKIMSKQKRIKTIFILNDKKSALIFNQYYKTDKFRFLPDPFIPIKPSIHKENFREIYKISPSQKLFIHFGGLTYAKGTLTILDTIQLLDENELKKYVFVFAGKIYNDIKSIFYKKIDSLKGKVTIIVKDEFCEFDFLGSLCESCDAILIPYKRTSQSSGVIGYASQFEKPVIGPGKGLLGNLIREYELGIAIGNCSPEEIRRALQLVSSNFVKKPTHDYCKDNNVKNFIESISTEIAP